MDEAEDADGRLETLDTEEAVVEVGVSIGSMVGSDQCLWFCSLVNDKKSSRDGTDQGACIQQAYKLASNCDLGRFSSDDASGPEATSVSYVTYTRARCE